MYSAILSCLALLFLAPALSASSSFDGKPAAQKQSKKTIRYECPPDSAVVARLNDTVSLLLFSAKRATVYQLNPSVHIKDDDKTIGGVVVEKNLGRMSDKSLFTLQMVLSDKNSYSDTPVIPLTPFAPTIAVELSGRQGSLCLLFSFLSQEVGIVRDGLLVATHRYKGKGLMAKIFRQYIPQDYMNYLTNL